MSNSSNQVLTVPLSQMMNVHDHGLISLVIVDDHNVVRQGIRAMLAIEDDIEVLGDYSSAEEAIPRIEELCPDIVLLDCRMPGMNGIEACRTLQAKGLNCDVIMLTLYEDHFAEAMRAGARGYLPKEINREELVATIRQVYSQRRAPQQEDPSPSFDTVDLVILAPAETSQIVRFIKFAPTILMCSIEQVVKLMDESTAVTIKFPKSLKEKDIAEKLQKLSNVKLVEKKLAAKPGFLWPFGGLLRSNKDEKKQIMIILEGDPCPEEEYE